MESTNRKSSGQNAQHAPKINRDEELRRLVIQAAVENPGLVPSMKAEEFLIDQSKKPEHWRLSPAQKNWMIKIAEESLRITIPERLR